MRSVRPSRSVCPLFRPAPDERLALHVLPGEKKGDVGHNLADPGCQRYRQHWVHRNADQRADGYVAAFLDA